MKFQEEIKTHLSGYKKEYFPKLEDGIWKRNKLKYSHILPEENKIDNLLPRYREELSDYIDKNKIKLHSDFHHLNSSQAMCLNMFYPLIKEKKLDLLLKVLHIEYDLVDYNSVCFEKESNIEKEMGRRPTSFDFYFKTLNGKAIHFEIKYTEQEFGKAKRDPMHSKKYNSVYEKHCGVINPQYCGLDIFLANYQLMRNILHVSENSYVVFLFPKANERIYEQSEFAKQDIVKLEFQKNIVCLTWEELLGSISRTKDFEKLASHIDDFKKKYKITLSE